MWERAATGGWVDPHTVGDGAALGADLTHMHRTMYVKICKGEKENASREARGRKATFGSPGGKGDHLSREEL